MRKTLYLRVSQWKSRPSHFYGFVYEVDTDKEKEVLVVLQCATRQRVIEIAKRDLPQHFPGQKLKLVVKRGVYYF